MARKFFGVGARGDIVARIQQSLRATGHDPQDIDGVFGEHTLDAVVAFQGERKLDIHGSIDEATWTALALGPIPSVHERSLGVTASFEGHDYSLARGNFDGAWLTWGIIGFTLKYGQVQKILHAVEAKYPSLITKAFGRQASVLLQVIGQPAPQQKAWATSITVGGGNLAEPWRSGFAMLGSFPEVREEQRRTALEGYYKPALEAARQFGVMSELGVALMFDIFVQNGGISAASAEQIREDVAASHNALESNIREIIADAIAEDAIPKYRENVRARKLAIARGKGAVNGTLYDLSKWGLADLAIGA